MKIDKAQTSRPIIFSSYSIKSILAGKKTQTRRIIKGERSKCPYGRVGDSLWVRETIYGDLEEKLSNNPPKGFIVGSSRLEDWGNYSYAATMEPSQEYSWVISSIHMPRWASRINLEITTLEPQKLQDITQDDAIAEGVYQWLYSIDGAPHDSLTEQWCRYSYTQFVEGKGCPNATPRALFALMWDCLNGKKADWHSNPDVWAISFKLLN